MTHKFYLLLLAVFAAQTGNTQNQWGWMHGDKSPNETGNYGSQGIADASNVPGSRIGAVTWIDKDGNLWLFGGHGKGEESRSGYLNDLWKYYPSSGVWIWIGGSKTINNAGSYGSKGSPSTNNLPGARQNAIGWTDDRGNFWLFGGEGMVPKKEKDKDNNEGNGNNGNGNGSKNDDEKDDDEKDRDKEKKDDKDDEGDHDNGRGNDDGRGNNEGHGGDDSELESTEGLLNDLWMYSPSSKAWTWVSGKDDTNEKGKYGNLAEPSGSSFPGARSLSIGWKDEAGNLWLFGGRGYSSKSEVSDLNDVWKYSPTSNMWTWMKGSQNGNANGHFGEKGIPNDDNSPGARRGSTAWIDKDGNFWMFGGGTYSGLFSDLWKFNAGTNKWVWMSGSKTTDHVPVFKSKGVPDRDGNPGSRTLASGWVDGGGNLWLFGGQGYGKQTGTAPVNSLWKYNVTTNEWTFVKGEAAIHSAAVFGSKGVQAVSNNPAGTANNAKWMDQQGNFWIFGGQSSAGYLNQMWKFSACTADIIGNITPASASICGGATQQLTASGGSTYSWLRDGSIIDGETSATINVTQPGTYSVIIFNGGCSGTASNTAVVSADNAVSGIRYTDVSTAANVPATLNAREIGVAYEWTPSIGLNNTSSVIPTVTTASEREYTVTITTEKGCTITDTVLVKINGDKKIFVPTAFTPNKNGVNDVLRPLGIIVSVEYFRVFNRWGGLLFQTNEIGAGWDGRYKGVEQPSDTYTWMLSGKTADGNTLKLSGKTLLIR